MIKTAKLLRKLKNIYSPNVGGENTLMATLALVKKAKRANPIKICIKALKILSPSLKVLSNVKAGRIIFVPAPIPARSRYYYAIRWLYNATREKSNKIKQVFLLAREMQDILRKRGQSLRLKNEFVKTIKAARINTRYKKRYRKRAPIRRISLKRKLKLKLKALRRIKRPSMKRQSMLKKAPPIRKKPTLDPLLAMVKKPKQKVSEQPQQIIQSRRDQFQQYPNNKKKKTSFQQQPMHRNPKHRDKVKKPSPGKTSYNTEGSHQSSLLSWLL